MTATSTTAAPSGDLEADEAPLTKSEARALTQKIRGQAEAMFSLLEEAHRRKVWRPLGYASWREYLTAEFGMSTSNAHRLLNQATVTRALRGAATPPGRPARGTPELPPPSARQAEAIRPKLPEVTREVSRRIAAGEEPEAVVPDVVERMAAEVRPAVRKGRAAPPAPEASPEYSLDASALDLVRHLYGLADADVSSVPDVELRALEAWCQRVLASRGHDDPHETCQRTISRLRGQLTKARKGQESLV